jgi:hypothetical protein
VQSTDPHRPSHTRSHTPTEEKKKKRRETTALRERSNEKDADRIGSGSVLSFQHTQILTQV